MIARVLRLGLLLVGACVGACVGAASSGTTRPSTSESAATFEVAGRVTDYTTAPHGEMDGVVLEDGTRIHFSPRAGAALLPLVQRGQTIRVVGWRSYGAGGERIEADTITSVGDGRTVDVTAMEERERTTPTQPRERTTSTQPRERAVAPPARTTHGGAVSDHADGRRAHDDGGTDRRLHDDAERRHGRPAPEQRPPHPLPSPYGGRAPPARPARHDRTRDRLGDIRTGRPRDGGEQGVQLRDRSNRRRRVNPGTAIAAFDRAGVGHGSAAASDPRARAQLRSATDPGAVSAAERSASGATPAQNTRRRSD